MNQNITTKVHWKCQDNEPFIKGKYSRAHVWELESGTQINVSASVHIVPQPFSNPELIDPEEAFVCSVASCHMLFFLSIMAKKRITVLQYDDFPVATLSKNALNKVAMTEIILHPKVIIKEDISKDRLRKVHELAHENCFIANSIQSKIQIKIQ